VTTQIRRADYPDYMSYLDAIAAPVGGVDSHVVWDEVEEEWVLDQERGADRRRRDETRRRPAPPPTS
jgi:hypothetical protein